MSRCPTNFIAGLIALLLLGACGDGSSDGSIENNESGDAGALSPATSTPPRYNGNNESGDVSTACAEAFKNAAAVSEFQDTHEDLFPAYSACKTLDEWKAADVQYPDAIDGVDPVLYAGNVCEGNSARLGDTPICKAIAQE